MRGMDCLLPHVLAVLAGDAAPVDARILTPPSQLDGRARAAAAGKALYGERMAHSLDTANFTVQWEDDALDPQRVAAIAAALEEGWAALVEAQAWPMPEGDDRYLQWVILDETLSGSGYTTLYTSDEFPDGYPVMFLNPTYAADQYPDFALSVAVHEFSHALQHRHRGWGAGALEAWYWEASAEWMAELGVPDVDTYAISTYWYAQRPDLAFSSMVDYHQYGMLVLPAYLDEYVGPGTLQATWLRGGELHDDAWDVVIADATGLAFADVLADLGGAFAGGALAESALYYAPVYAAEHRGTPAAETLDPPDVGGVHYVAIGASSADLAVEGPADARWGYDGTWSDTPPAEGPVVLALTGTSTEGEIRYGTDLSADTDTGEAPDEEQEEESPAACGCATGGGLSAWAVVAAVGMVRRRRRRPEVRAA